MATPPDFTAGQVLEANAHMNKIGLWLIKTQSTGTAQSSIVVSDVFSADYQNYVIRVSGGTASTTLGLNLTLGATVTGYYYGGSTGTYAGGAPASFASANTTSFAFAGSGETTGLIMRVELTQPFTTERTGYTNQYATQRTNGSGGFVAGYLDNATSYTGFTITTSTGTVSGGMVYVYGWRD